MDATKLSPTDVCHMVAVPYPGRGHVNPMMNLCKSLVSSSPNQHILITFVVTEEWHTFIASDNYNMPSNIRFRTIPNVLPSELVRGSDFPTFYEAVMTKMEAPFEMILDQIEMPVTIIVADTELVWAVPVGKRRNINVVLLWTMSASILSMFLHLDLLLQNGHLPSYLLEHGEDRVEYIPGVSSIRIADLPSIFHGLDEKVSQLTMECISLVKDAEHILINTTYELEFQVLDILEAIPLPLYTIGPAIPYFDIKDHPSATNSNDPNYLQWLDSQPRGSVLYISLGSYLSVSSEKMDEIVAGVSDSGVSYLWVARGDTSRLRQSCGKNGFVVPWCDQLRVLSHSSVGGFLSHCGWNSTLEAVFAGVPLLTFPISFDQPPNSKQIVEDWKVGWRVKERVGAKDLVTREEIASLVRRFMDFESSEGIEIRKRAKEVQEVCGQAIAEGGPSINNIKAFIRNVSKTKAIKLTD